MSPSPSPSPSPLAQALRTLQENPSIRIPYHGICYNVSFLVRNDRETMRQLHRLISSWPERAGDDPMYPVEGEAHRSDHNLWDNPRRLALLDWCISQC